MVDVSIITVGTNERELIHVCLNSISNSRTKYQIETIVVDNASTDGTSKMVSNNFRDIILLHNQKMLGYIQSNNLAIKAAKGRYIMLINSDVELREDTVETLVEFMDRHPKAAVSTCRLNFDDGTLQLNCRRFPTPKTYFFRMPHFFRWLKFGKKFAMSKPIFRYLMLDYDHKEAKEVDWVVSALFFMRKSAIEDVGMLDENLLPPFYLEDVDWCFRAHLKGWKVYYVPETCAIHYYRRGSVKKFSKLSIVHLVNTLIFFKKHWLSMALGKHRR